MNTQNTTQNSTSNIMDSTEELKYYIFKYCEDPIDTINLIFGLDELYQFYHTNEKFSHYYYRCKELLPDLNDKNIIYLTNCLTIIKNMGHNKEIDLLVLKDTYSDLDSDSDYSDCNSDISIDDYTDCDSNISIDDFNMNELYDGLIEHECKEVLDDIIFKVILNN